MRNCLGLFLSKSWIYGDNGGVLKRMGWSCCSLGFIVLFFPAVLTQNTGDVASKVHAFTLEIPLKLYRHDEK